MSKRHSVARCSTERGRRDPARPCRRTPPSASEETARTGADGDREHLLVVLHLVADAVEVILGPVHHDHPSLVRARAYREPTSRNKPSTTTQRDAKSRARLRARLRNFPTRANSGRTRKGPGRESRVARTRRRRRPRELRPRRWTAGRAMGARSEASSEGSSRAAASRAEERGGSGTLARRCSRAFQMRVASRRRGLRPRRRDGRVGGGGKSSRRRGPAPRSRACPRRRRGNRATHRSTARARGRARGASPTRPRRGTSRGRSAGLTCSSQPPRGARRAPSRRSNRRPTRPTGARGRPPAGCRPRPT